MITGRLDSDSRLALPSAVAEALRLSGGDEVAFVIQGDRVVLTKLREGAERALAGFSEWTSEADRRVYGGL